MQIAVASSCTTLFSHIWEGVGNIYGIQGREGLVQTLYL